MTDLPNQVSMLIIMHMYSKRKRYLLRTVLIILLNIDFPRSKGGSKFAEKNKNS